jgi:tRNA-2-methylthio-N6-dimethylallyladenosine synthase
VCFNRLHGFAFHDAIDGEAVTTFYIKTYGCQMNERDSEALQCLLEARGWRAVQGENDADVVLFNTCSVRDQAERKAIGKMGLLKRIKRERPEVILGIIGCMAQNHGRELLDQLPHVDLVVGTDRLQDVPDLLEDVAGGREGLVATDVSDRVPDRMNGHVAGEVTAYVAVMRGCDRFCSYCIVPYTRGREKSRTIEDIVTEVRTVVAAGTREIFLLGQNITAYGIAEARRDGSRDPEASPFADLLRAVHEVPGVERIRFTSPHVAFMNDAFIRAVCELPKVCKAFHIPVQSGSDRILERMRRGYTAAEYLDRVRRIRAGAPEAAFSTDVIVGFPGETEEDFAATRRLMAEVDFDMAYIFRYSPRSGTKAAEKYADDVPEDVKLERNKLLLDDLESGVARRNRAYLGQTVTVLTEGPSKRNAARWCGRSDTNKVCIFTPSPDLRPGELVPVRIRRVTSHSLFGDIVGRE